MSGMTRRERLTAIFEGRTPDRPAVKLWGCDVSRAVPHPAYRPVKELGLAKTDLFFACGSPFDLYAGAKAADITESFSRPGPDPDWVDRVTILHTPEGDLESTFQASTRKRPGYRKTHFLKEPDDIRRLLSIPYEPYPFSAQGYRDADGAVGDGGLPMFGLDHAMYGLCRAIGSENFALWSTECEPLMLEAIAIFAERLRAHLCAALGAGVRGVFGWVGPELCIPPLMSPAHFERYVSAFDKPLIGLIHEGGGHAWVHSHGKMGPVLERFMEMGVDVLNPIEPPPMGDVTLPEAFARVGERMALEGNIETHDMMSLTVAELGPKIHAAIQAGRGRRFILCPSSGYQENPEPSPREIENWLFYINEGVRCAEECGDRG